MSTIDIAYWATTSPQTPMPLAVAMIETTPKATVETGSTISRRRNEKRRCRSAFGTVRADCRNKIPALAAATAVTVPLSKNDPIRGASATPTSARRMPARTVATVAVEAASSRRSSRWIRAANIPEPARIIPMPARIVPEVYWPSSSGVTSLARTTNVMSVITRLIRKPPPARLTPLITVPVSPSRRRSSSLTVPVATVSGPARRASFEIAVSPARPWRGSGRCRLVGRSRHGERAAGPVAGLRRRGPRRRCSPARRVAATTPGS